MNPVALVYFVVALILVALAWPLVRGRIRPNRWYGIRIPAAFTSEAAWLDLNRYGGRLLLWWGLAHAATAALGCFLPPEHWLAYNWTALAITLGGLAWIVGLVLRRARRHQGS